jgi:nitrogen fixation NifU-like protein
MHLLEHIFIMVGFPSQSEGITSCDPGNVKEKKQLLLGRSTGAFMYSERLLDHFQNPRNVGELPPPAVTVEVSNPACGDILRLSVRFEENVAAEVCYKVRGCTASIAAGSALTEWMGGKTRAELAAFQPALIDDAIGGLPAESKHAAVLCADGVKAVLRRA